MHLDVGQVVPHPPDPGPRDQLAIVQLDPLQVVAVDEVVEGLIGDERTVVQLEDGEGLAGAGRGAEVPDPLVRDELAVGEGEGLEAGTVGGQLGHRRVSDHHALFKVHPLQVVAATRQSLGKYSIVMKENKSR